MILANLNLIIHFAGDFTFINATNFPLDIPCALNEVQENLPSLICLLEKRMHNNISLKKEEKVYFNRVIRFLSYIRNEINFFTCHEDMYLLHMCINK